MFLLQFRFNAPVDQQHKTTFIVVTEGTRYSKHINRGRESDKATTLRDWGGYVNTFRLELIK